MGYFEIHASNFNIKDLIELAHLNRNVILNRVKPQFPIACCSRNNVEQLNNRVQWNIIWNFEGDGKSIKGFIYDCN